MHGWYVSNRMILITGLSSVFSLNFFLFLVFFSERPAVVQVFISMIFGVLIMTFFYFIIKNNIGLLSKLLLFNGLIVSLVTLSVIETSKMVSRSVDSTRFKDISLIYQTPIIGIILLLIHLFEKKFSKIVVKTKYAYIIYCSTLFLSAMLVMFAPVNEFYNKFLLLPFALISGYAAFSFATKIFSHHVKHSKEFR